MAKIIINPNLSEFSQVLANNGYNPSDWFNAVVCPGGGGIDILGPPLHVDMNGVMSWDINIQKYGILWMYNDKYILIYIYIHIYNTYQWDI